MILVVAVQERNTSNATDGCNLTEAHAVASSEAHAEA